MSAELKIGQNISIVRIKSNGEQERYSSLIENVLDDETYFIAHPIKKGRYISFIKDTALKITYSVKNTGIFDFDCLVESSYDATDSVIKIRRTSEIRKTQRRNYYRIDVILDMVVSTGKDKFNDFTGEKTQLINISGGGAKFYTGKNISTNDIIYLEINQENTDIYTQARVVKVEYLEEPHKDIKNKLISAEFIDINEEDRNDIVKFVFTKERELLKKGK